MHNAVRNWSSPPTSFFWIHPCAKAVKRLLENNFHWQNTMQTLGIIHYWIWTLFSDRDLCDFWGGYYRILWKDCTFDHWKNKIWYLPGLGGRGILLFRGRMSPPLGHPLKKIAVMIQVCPMITKNPLLLISGISLYYYQDFDCKCLYRKSRHLHL